MRSILDVVLTCALCGKPCKVGDAEPDVDGDGSPGCPVTDCGGILYQTGTEGKDFIFEPNPTAA